MKPSSYDELQKRMEHEEVSAAADYREARDALAKHHGEMGKRATEQQRAIEAKEREVNRILEGDIPMGKEQAQTLIDHLRDQQKLREYRVARRSAYPATLPPGEMKPGQPIG